MVKLLYKIVLPIVAIFADKTVTVMIALMINIPVLILRMMQIQTKISVYSIIMDTLLVILGLSVLIHEFNIIWTLIFWFFLSLSLV